MLGSLPLLLVLAAFPPAAHVRQEALIEEERAAIAKELVSDLSELAEWCNEAKLFADRDQAYAKILLYDPEHDRARKFLRYRKDAQGKWVQSGDYREPKNRADGAVAELVERRDRAYRKFAGAMVALVDRHRLTLGDKGTQAIYAEVLAVDPEAPEVRARTREVKEGDQWQLRESARAKERREELRLFVEEGLAQAPTPKQGTLLPAEENLGIDWVGVEETEGVRVLGTVPTGEIAHTVQVVEAAASFFRKALDEEAKLYEGYKVFLLKNEKEKTSFLQRHPVVTPENRDYFMALVGTGLPNTPDYVHFSDEAAHRLDGVVRHTIGNLLRSSFNITTDQGWIWEGFGIYMTWRVVGTRLTWYVQQSDYVFEDGQELRSLLHVPTANWTDQAYKLLKSARRPDLADVMKRTVTQMRVEDMLYSYVLAAYLLEGCPEEAPLLLERIGKGESPSGAVRALFDIDIASLGERVLRWLSERK